MAAPVRDVTGGRSSKALRPAPPRDQITLLYLEGDAHLLDARLNLRRRRASHLEDEGGHPPRIERRQRAKQVVARHDAEAVPDCEVVDDPGPQPIIELKSIERSFGQFSQVDDRSRWQHPRPDLPQLAVPQSERFNRPLQI